MNLFSRINAPALGRWLNLTGAGYTLSPRAEFVQIERCCVFDTKGESLDPADLPANSLITIVPTASVDPAKCRAHLAINQMLSQFGIVSATQLILEPGDKLPALVMRTSKGCDLTKLPWVVRIYLEVK
jgi:hypothetical protein